MIDELINKLKGARLFTMDRFSKLGDSFRRDEWTEVWDTMEKTWKYLEELKGKEDEFSNSHK
jgi:hypothetical protein